MSQIVGIICKDGIIMASETQATIGDSKLMNAEKLTAVSFKNLDVMIGGVGDAAVSERTIGYIRESAATVDVMDEQSVIEVVENAVNRMRLDLFKGLQARDYALREQMEIFNRNDIGLIFGVVVNPTAMPSHIAKDQLRSSLYTIWLSNAVASKCSPFGVIGAADPLASYLLKQFKCEDLSWYEAACLAVDALERIKEDNIYCGGNITFGSIDLSIGERPTANVGKCWQGLVDRVVDKLKILRQESTKQYVTGLQGIMRQLHQENQAATMASILGKQ